jgi:hypothetical protein
MPSGGSPAAAGDAAAATAHADSLPAHLLTKIAAVVLAHAESALLGETSRCRTCHQHLQFRCVCTQGDRAGYWADIRVERDVSNCVHGSIVRLSSAEAAIAPPGGEPQAYRQALLGTVQCMRRVNKYWRDVVSYNLIDNLHLGRHLWSTTLPGRDAPACLDAAAALANSWPADFSQRFAAVKVLDLTGTCLETLPDGIRRMPELRRLVLTGVSMGALPHWMPELQLTELRLSSAELERAWYTDTSRGHQRDPTAGEKQASNTLVQRQQTLVAWLLNAQTRLPITLERLTIEWDTTAARLKRGLAPDENVVTELPPCIRYLTNLRSLSFTGTNDARFEFDLPEWLRELPHLMSFQHNAHASHQSATVLGSMSLECLHISSDEYAGWMSQLPSLLAPSNTIRTSLRTLRFDGFEAMTELPLCLRHLQLTSLDLDGSLTLNTLPEWLGEMPLVHLSLVLTDVSSLPVSLRRVNTLRLIRTLYSPLGFDEDELPGEQLEEIGRMEAELLPLSAAVHQLKFEISYEDGKTAGWCGGVWDPIQQPQLLEELREEAQINQDIDDPYLDDGE